MSLDSNLNSKIQFNKKLSNFKKVNYYENEFKCHNSNKLSFDDLRIFYLFHNSKLSKSKSFDNVLCESTYRNKNNNFHDEVVKNCLIEKLMKKNTSFLEEIKNLKNCIELKDAKYSEELNDVKKNFFKKINTLNKQLNNKSKDLEGIVVKYAISEKKILDAKKSKDDFEKKYKDALKDKDSLLIRIKGLSNEKASLMDTLDFKINELLNVQKELEKSKRLIKEKDAQLMQIEFKLNKEQETQSSNTKIIECSMQSINEVNKKLENFKQNKQKEIENLNIEEVNKLKNKNIELEESNQILKSKIIILEENKNKFEEEKKKLNIYINDLKNQFNICTERIEECKKLKIEYDQNLVLLDEYLKKINDLKNENEELICEMKACRQKEGELLEFTDLLQTKTVNLQSDHSLYKNKSIDLELELNNKTKLIESLKNEIDVLKLDIESKVERYQNELNLLTKKLTQEENLIAKLNKQNEEIENENKVLKKKHLNSIKELNKEILILKKKINQNENNFNTSETLPIFNNSDTISNSSKTNSTNSLEPNGHNELHENFNNIQTLNGNSNNQTYVGDIINHLDKNTLLNKILATQNNLYKLNSRVEFLEDHNQQLLNDLKKKSKIIQSFILKEAPASLSTSDMETFKHQISKKGNGIMASLYMNGINDSSITLEFSLEINRKLQTVLEDTILKNITLKENIDTLGAEIARMTKENM